MISIKQEGPFNYVSTKGYIFGQTNKKKKHTKTAKLITNQLPLSDDISLYSKEFDDSVDYYVYYPYNYNHRSFIDFLSDKLVNHLFEELTKYFTSDDLLNHLYIQKSKEYIDNLDSDSDSDSDDIYLYIINSGKYTRRYNCTCYNWLCDGCIEDQNEEIAEDIKHIINKRYVITAFYECLNYSNCSYASIVLKVKQLVKDLINKQKKYTEFRVNVHYGCNYGCFSNFTSIVSKNTVTNSELLNDLIGVMKCKCQKHDKVYQQLDRTYQGVVIQEISIN